MPLYEYKCHLCGKTFEALQKFSDEPIKIHDECGGKTERLISATAFHLKGSGWYATDYAKGSGVAPKSGEGKSAESGSDKVESKETKADSAASSSADSKPAAESKPATPKPAPTVSSDSK